MAGWREQRQLDHVTMLAEERVQLVQGYGRARLQIQEVTAMVSRQQGVPQRSCCRARVTAEVRRPCRVSPEQESSVKSQGLTSEGCCRLLGKQSAARL